MSGSRAASISWLPVFFLFATQAKGLELPAPTGPHAVGFWEISFKTDRPDELAKDPQTRRELLLQVWYPAAEGGRAKPYADAAVIDAVAKQFGMPVEFGSIVTHASPGAPILAGAFPLIVFSHGLSWPGILYQSIVEDIASRGYIVVVVNHPHGASAIHYPDGRIGDMSRWPDLPAGKQNEDFLAVQAAAWSADIRDTISYCLAWSVANASNPVAGHIDASCVVVMGHSLGGTAAIQTLDDTRVAAAVAFEGKARRVDGKRQDVAKPLLHLIGGYNTEELQGNQYHVIGDGAFYEVVINGAGHAYFADVIYIYKHFADAAWLQRHHYELEPDRILQITRDYVGAFLSRVLYGKSSMLLQPVSYAARVDGPQASGYPEVCLHITVR